MENKIELYTDINPYIVELADVLYEEFNDKTEEYMKEHFDDFIIEYLVDEMNVKYLGKINKSGLEKAIKETKVLYPKDIEKGLADIHISESLKRDTIDKISDGVGALKNIYEGISVATDIVDLYDSIQLYDDYSFGDKEKESEPVQTVNVIYVGHG